MSSKNNISKKKLSKFSGLSLIEIGKRCKVLGIEKKEKTLTGNLIYNFTNQEAGKILLYLDMKLPEKVIIEKTITYEIYNSKMNN